MPLEINIEVVGELGGSDELQTEIQRLVREATPTPCPLKANELTQWQRYKAQEPGHFHKHRCGAASDVVVQYQTHTNPPRKANLRIFFTMYAQPYGSGDMPEHVDDDIAILEATANEVVAQVLRHFRANLKGKKHGVVAALFAFPSGQPMGRYGEYQTAYGVVRDRFNRLLGGVPVVFGMFIAAGLGNWDFLAGPALGASSSAFAYMAVFAGWCTIDVRRLRGKIVFHGKA